MSFMNTQTQWTKESITKLLEVNDTAVCRALVVLYERQTASEQASFDTHDANGVGFSGAHAEFGTSCAVQYLRKGKLSEKQIAAWRKRTRNGQGPMKIAMYWKQLIQAIEEKNAK